MAGPVPEREVGLRPRQAGLGQPRAERAPAAAEDCSASRRAGDRTSARESGTSSRRLSRRRVAGRGRPLPSQRGSEARHPLPRRGRGPGGQGDQLRRPARRRRPGGARGSLRRRGRRRAGLPRHHRLARAAGDDRRAGAANRRQRVHPVRDRRRHPLGGRRPGRARRRRRQGLGQLRRAGAAGADRRAGRGVRLSVRGDRHRCQAPRRGLGRLRQRGSHPRGGSRGGRLGS